MADNPTRTVAIIGTRGYPSFYGGFETLVRHLAPYLADHGWHVVVYGRPDGVDDDTDRDIRVESVITAGVESKSLSTLTYGFTSALHAVSHKTDVAIVMNVANGFWLPLLAARGVPTLVNVDGIEWEREKWGASAKAVFRAGARMTSKFATSLIYDSKALATRWTEYSGRDGIFIPYGGQNQRGHDVAVGLSRRKYVLMVARFVPENTIEPFLTAARTLSEKWQVVIVGSSGYGGEIDDHVRELDSSCANVHWYGHICDDEQLFGLWENAGAYFHGHSVGGTNPALVQAMACGAPTVARDTPYNREVLGEAALFVAPESNAIADAIDGLISDGDLQEQLCDRAQERARHFYNWEEVCAAYELALRDHVGATTESAR